MAKSSVLWTERARHDLLAIYDYILEAGRPIAAFEFAARIEDRCAALADFPLSGKSRPDIRPLLRTIPFESVVIAYEFVGADVVIGRIIHGKRDVEALLREPD